MEVGGFKEFHSTLVVLLDDSPSCEGEFAFKTPHENKNEKVRNAMRKYTNAKVESIGVAKGEDVRSVYSKVAQLVEGKGPDDLVIVYFHGSAGFKDNKYCFKFQGNRTGWFNAYELIWRLSISEATCLFILDCECYTRMIKNVEAEFELAEVIGRGAAYHDPEGETIDTSHDFTVSFLRNLAKFKNRHGKSGKQKRKRQRTNRGQTARTIPQLMQFDKRLMSNPLRVKHGPRACKYVQAFPASVHEHDEIHFGYTVREQDLKDAREQIQQPVTTTTPLPAGLSAVWSTAAACPPNITNPAFRHNPAAFSDEGYISEGDEDDEDVDEYLFVRK